MAAAQWLEDFQAAVDARVAAYRAQWGGAPPPAAPETPSR